MDNAESTKQEMTEIKVKFSIDPSVYFKGREESDDGEGSEDDVDSPDGQSAFGKSEDQNVDTSGWLPGFAEATEDADVTFEGNAKIYDTSKMTDLQKHDAKYHPGGYKEGQKCKFRENLESGNNVDMLDPENVEGEDIQGKTEPGSAWVMKNVADDFEKMLKEKVDPSCSVELELSHVNNKGVCDFFATIKTPVKKDKDTKAAVAEFFKLPGVSGDVEYMDSSVEGKKGDKHSEHLADFSIDILNPKAKAKWAVGANHEEPKQQDAKKAAKEAAKELEKKAGPATVTKEKKPTAKIPPKTTEETPAPDEEGEKTDTKETKPEDKPKFALGSPEFEEWLNSKETEDFINSMAKGSKWKHDLDDAAKKVGDGGNVAQQTLLAKAQEAYAGLEPLIKEKLLYDAMATHTKDKGIAALYEYANKAVNEKAAAELQPWLDALNGASGKPGKMHWVDNISALKAKIPSLKGFAKKKAEMMLKVWEKKLAEG